MMLPQTRIRTLFQDSGNGIVKFSRTEVSYRVRRMMHILGLVKGYQGIKELIIQLIRTDHCPTVLPGLRLNAEVGLSTRYTACRWSGGLAVQPVCSPKSVLLWRRSSGRLYH
jgi:hypothetical protein